MDSRSEINKIIKEPTLYDRTTDDHCPDLEDVDRYFQYDQWVFLGVYCEEKIIGLYYVHDSRWGPKIHYQVLPAYQQYAYWPCVRATKWFASVYGDLYTEIPTLYPNVIAFAEKVGFKRVTTMKNEHLKNGVEYDNVVLQYKWAA